VHSRSGQEFTFSAGMTVDEIEKQMYEDAGGTETTSSVRRKAASQRIVLVKGEQGYEAQTKVPAGTYTLVFIARKPLPMPRR
jgi:hypothetical protein